MEEWIAHILMRRPGSAGLNVQSPLRAVPGSCHPGPVEGAKVAAVQTCTARGFGVVAMVDNEPGVLKAIARFDLKRESLLLCRPR